MRNINDYPKYNSIFIHASAATHLKNARSCKYRLDYAKNGIKITYKENRWFNARTYAIYIELLLDKCKTQLFKIDGQNAVGVNIDGDGATMCTMTASEIIPLVEGFTGDLLTAKLFLASLWSSNTSEPELDPTDWL